MNRMTDYFKPEVFEPVRADIEAFLEEVTLHDGHPHRTLGRVFDPIDPIIKVYYKQILSGKPVSSHVISKLTRRLTTYAVARDLVPMVFTEAERAEMRLLTIFITSMDYTGYAVLPLKMVSSKQWDSPHGEMQVVSLTNLLTGPPVENDDTTSLRGL